MPDQPDRKQINFTIVPDEQPGEPRTYANFCSIAHTPSFQHSGIRSLEFT